MRLTDENKKIVEEDDILTEHSIVKLSNSELMKSK